MKKHIIILSGISAVTILLFLSGSFTEIFQFDRTAITQFQLWRLFTGHFTHWDLSHLFWDLSAFIIASFAICRMGKAKLIAPLMISSAIFISFWILFFDRDINLYRGLSGIDTTLVVFLCIEMIAQSLRNKDKRRLLYFSILGLIVIGKTIYELLTGNVIFANSGNFIPLFSAHLAGIIVAIVFYFTSKASQVLVLNEKATG